MEHDLDSKMSSRVTWSHGKYNTDSKCNSSDRVQTCPVTILSAALDNTSICKNILYNW